MKFRLCQLGEAYLNARFIARPANPGRFLKEEEIVHSMYAGSTRLVRWQETEIPYTNAGYFRHFRRGVPSPPIFLMRATERRQVPSGL